MLRLYTDESPGLKVDPVVVLVLSLVFIFSVVALHSKYQFFLWLRFWKNDHGVVYGSALLTSFLVIAKITRRFSS